MTERRKKWLNEGIARGREQGREEVIHELEAWDERRRRAEERCKEFNEPPPFTGDRSGRVETRRLYEPRGEGDSCKGIE